MPKTHDGTKSNVKTTKNKERKGLYDAGLSQLERHTIHTILLIGVSDATVGSWPEQHWTKQDIIH
jgi:hypothetical protein